MHAMTEDNVKSAFAGESQAHMKYMNFADKAKREDKPNVARLFQAAAFSEQVHASAHLRVIDGLKSTSDNLAAAVQGESFEVEEMYAAYMAVAQEQNEQPALQSMQRAFVAEKIHRNLFGRAKTAVDAGADAEISEHIRLSHMWVHSGS